MIDTNDFESERYKLLSRKLVRNNTFIVPEQIVNLIFKNAKLFFILHF